VASRNCHQLATCCERNSDGCTSCLLFALWDVTAVVMLDTFLGYTLQQLCESSPPAGDCELVAHGSDTS